MPFRLSPRARSIAWIHSAKHTTASPSVRDQITNEARTFPPGLSYILCPRSTVPVGAIHGRPTFLRTRTTHHPLSTSDLPPVVVPLQTSWPRLGYRSGTCQARDGDCATRGLAPFPNGACPLSCAHHWYSVGCRGGIHPALLSLRAKRSNLA